MDFTYVITFEYGGLEGLRGSIARSGKGLFYPHDGGFNLEHMLWQMTEEYGRPERINVELDFIGVQDNTPQLTKGD